MKSKLDSFVDLFVANWIIFVGVIMILGTAIFIMISSGTISATKADTTKLVNKTAVLKGVLSDEKKSNQQDGVKKITKYGISAQSLGQKMIDSQKVMVDFYLTPGKKSSSEKDKLSKYQAFVSDHSTIDNVGNSNMWLRNKNWVISIDTVVKYSVDQMPVIFTMKNKSGDLMGLVTANYDSDSDQFDKVNVQYTNAGLKDFETITGDAGGRK